MFADRRSIIFLTLIVLVLIGVVVAVMFSQRGGGFEGPVSPEEAGKLESSPVPARAEEDPTLKDQISGPPSGEQPHLPDELQVELDEVDKEIISISQEIRLAARKLQAATDAVIQGNEENKKLLASIVETEKDMKRKVEQLPSMLAAKEEFESANAEFKQALLTMRNMKDADPDSQDNEEGMVLAQQEGALDERIGELRKKSEQALISVEKTRREALDKNLTVKKMSDEIKVARSVLRKSVEQDAGLVEIKNRLKNLIEKRADLTEKRIKLLKHEYAGVGSDG